METAMSDDVATAAAGLSAAASTNGAPGAVKVSQNAPRTMKMLGAALAACCVITGLVIGAVYIGKWPDSVAHERIMALAWIGWIAVVGPLLVVIAFCSPWLGRVSASVAGAHLDVDGRRDA
jgi:hypothetical protein